MKYFSILILIFSLNLGVYSQNEIVVIAHNNYLVGAVQNGKWSNDTEDITNAKKTTKFIGFDSFKNTKPSDIYGTPYELGCGSIFFYFGKTTDVPEKIYEAKSLKPVLALGANANWNPLPRVPKKLDLTNKTYQKIALDFLQTKGIKINRVKLENAFSIDLEGDGTDEIFLEATTYKDKDGDIYFPSARAGDYSFVLMRKVINGKPKDFLIEGEFSPKKPEIADYISEFDLSAFADLNGDGKMEVILKGLYSYGGESTEIFESNNNNLKEVLSEECGD